MTSFLEKLKTPVTWNVTVNKNYIPYLTPKILSTWEKKYRFLHLNKGSIKLEGDQLTIVTVNTIAEQSNIEECLKNLYYFVEYLLVNANNNTKKINEFFNPDAGEPYPPLTLLN